MRKREKRKKIKIINPESRIDEKMGYYEKDDEEESFEPEFYDPTVFGKTKFIDSPKNHQLIKMGRPNVKRKGKRKANNHSK